jgi:outer membrane lipoprotein SlyB
MPLPAPSSFDRNDVEIGATCARAIVGMVRRRIEDKRKELRMKQRLMAAMLSACALAVTTGCSTFGPQDYDYSEVGSRQSVAYGTVESVRPVRLNEDHAEVGTAAGAVVGGLLGSTLFRGPARLASTVVGAVAGGVGGNALEHEATARKGDEIVVRLDRGETIAVTQGGLRDFERGQRVRVLTGPGGSRVERA